MDYGVGVILDLLKSQGVAENTLVFFSSDNGGALYAKEMGVCAMETSIVRECTVNSLMFTGINVCVFETKPCLRGLLFAVSSGL